MDIAIVTTAKTNEEAKILLSMLGMPFREKDEKAFELKIQKKDDKEKVKEKGNQKGARV